MKKIILATHNLGKVKELQAILSLSGIEVYSLDQVEKSVPEVEETGKTFAENALLKARIIAKVLQMPVVADDSGIVVDALQGRPGVLSARYTLGSDSDRNTKLLAEMNGKTNRTARFVCVIAYVDEKGTEKTFEGICEGKVALQAQGEHGFGYDSVFIPTGFTQTNAQLEPEVKNRISHRAQALQLFVMWLEKQV